MSHVATPSVPAAGDRFTAVGVLKVLGAAALVVLLLRFFVRDALPYLISYTEGTYAQFWPHSGRLYLHIVGGSVALLLGPLQFWTGLRRRSMKLHRWAGKGYMAGIALGAAGAYWLAFTTDSFPGVSWSVALGGLATAWVLTTSMAYASIRAGKIELHKEWMVRSYVVTFAFVSFRWLVDEAPVLSALPPPDWYPSAIWISWALPMMFAEAIIQGRKLRRA